MEFKGKIDEYKKMEVDARFGYDIEFITDISKIINALEKIVANRVGFTVVLVDPFKYFENIKTILINTKLVINRLMVGNWQKYPNPLDQYKFLESDEGQKEIEKLLWRKLEHYKENWEKIDEKDGGLTPLTIIRIIDVFARLRGRLVKAGKIHQFQELDLPEF